VAVKEILVTREYCLSCHNCELACAVQHSKTGSLTGAMTEAVLPLSRINVEKTEEGAFPLQCRHCNEPKCVQACMTGALFQNEEKGLVMQEKEKCVGCWMCVMLCPFGSIEMDRRLGKALKCDRCEDRETPACVEACPTGSISFQSIYQFNRDRRRKYLVNLTPAAASKREGL